MDIFDGKIPFEKKELPKRIRRKMERNISYRERNLKACECKTLDEFIWKWENHMLSSNQPHVPGFQDSAVYSTPGAETMFTIWLIMLIPAILMGGFAGFLTITVLCALPYLLLFRQEGKHEQWVDERCYDLAYKVHVAVLVRFILDVKEGKRTAKDFKLIEKNYPSGEEYKQWERAALDWIAHSSEFSDVKEWIENSNVYLARVEKKIEEDKWERELKERKIESENNQKLIKTKRETIKQLLYEETKKKQDSKGDVNYEG